MKLAIFDFDGTLFLKDTLPALGQEWLKQGRSRGRYYLVYFSIMPAVFIYKLGFLSREIMKYRAMKRFQRLFKKMSREEVKAFFEKAYPGIRAHFNPRVVREVKKAREEGYRLVLLSGAYLELLSLVAKDLQFDTVFGAELYFREGMLDLEREISCIDGATKLKLLQEAFADYNVDWAASRSYGDSYDDKPVMEIAGEAVAVNPDGKLYNYAVESNWRLIQG